MKQLAEALGYSAVSAMTTFPVRKYRNCGGNHPIKPREQCPEYGTVCNNCRKPNYWGNVCRFTRREQWKQQQNTTLTASNGTRHSLRPTEHDTHCVQRNTNQAVRCCNVPCQYSHSRWFDTKFFIVDTDRPGILGLPSLGQLDLVMLHCAVQAEESNDVQIDDLFKQYPSQFDCIGNFQDEYHIVTGDTCSQEMSNPAQI